MTPMRLSSLDSSEEEKRTNICYILETKTKDQVSKSEQFPKLCNQNIVFAKKAKEKSFCPQSRMMSYDLKPREPWGRRM